jgi:hypothetical protein
VSDSCSPHRATTKEAGHEKNTIFVGLDVHKNSIDIALADAGREGDVRFYGSIGGDLESLHKVVRKLQSTGPTLRFVYEAGPCGYDIYRSFFDKTRPRLYRGCPIKNPP